MPEWRHVMEVCEASDTESVRNSWQLEQTPRLDTPFMALQTTHEVTALAGSRTFILMMTLSLTT